MMFNNWFKNLTSEDVARWVRTITQFLAGSGFGVGLLSGDKWVTAGGVIISIISFIFMLMGNTLASKTAEVIKSSDIKSITPTPSAPAAIKEAAKPA